MSAKQFFKLLVTKRNRVVSMVTQGCKAVALSLEITGLRWLAACKNLLDRTYFRRITEEQLPIRNAREGLVIHCMGNVDLSDPSQYERDLASLRELLEQGDLSLAHANGSTCEEDEETLQLLRRSGVTLLSGERMIDARILCTEFGRVGIMTYERYHEAARNSHVKLELMRCLLALRAKRADYIIVYVGNRMKRGKIGAREARLYRLLSHMGADYIVGVTPNRRSAGTTYRKRGGGIGRSVYSLGTFLSNDGRISHRRVVLRLKLRKINGKLQLFFETYYPCYRTEETGFVSLLRPEERLPEDVARAALAQTEREMRRIRPANRAFTVGEMMDLLHTPLPEECRYLAEFSVGKVCARSFEVMPGDVFFFREPFEDPNDLEPVNPRRRRRIARKAARKGALLLVSFQKLPFACRYVQMENVMEAHIRVCAYLRSQFRMRTIGITGSIGKTSTKDMLAEVMKMRYHTVKSERNSNVQVKIGMNLQKLDSSCDVFIQEIGGGRPGGASRHARMVLPDVTVVTNIGDAHIGNFGCREKLMENKLQIIDGMTEQGVLYLNGDDPLLVSARPGCKTVFYAVHNKQADYYVEDLTEEGFSTVFYIVRDGRRVQVRLNVLGEYNVLNAVCCFAIGRQFDIPEEDILQGLTHFHPSGIRQNLVQVCGRSFFMDCYNASSESVKSSMEVLTKIAIEPGKKRIAVLGDITGMGELTEEIHRAIGHTLLHYPVDRIILFGDSVRYTRQVLQENGVDCLHVTTRQELNHALEQLIDVGDVAMFKGSSKMLLEQSVDMVYGTRMTDQRLLDEAEYRRVQRGSVAYNLFGTYATVVNYSARGSQSRRVHVAAKVGSIPVVNIGPAFTKRNVVEVQLPATIRHIGSRAFFGCRYLEQVQLPPSLKYIGSSAFRNCRSLRRIDLPQGLLHIDAKAFWGCSGLTEITIPDSVVQIGPDAFKNCEGVTICCSPGSYAQRYLEEEQIPYVLKIVLPQGSIRELPGLELSPERRLKSENAYVASALQSGRVAANAPGETRLWVEQDGVQVRTISCVVTQGEGKLPLLLDRFNRISQAAGPMMELPAEFSDPDKTIQVEQKAAEAFCGMCRYAREQGIWLYATQGHRSLEEQEELIRFYTQRDGAEAAMRRCAPAGFSEHHSGLALDVNGGNWESGAGIQNPQLTWDWLAENCFQFGFMIKNLKGKEHITGTRYEPWHIRYLGDMELCRYLHDHSITLNEYLDELAETSPGN